MWYVSIVTRSSRDLTFWKSFQIFVEITRLASYLLMGQMMTTTDFEDFVGRHRTAVLMRVREVLGSRGNLQDAEDITQETFLHYWEHQDSMDPEREHTGLLIRSARQRAIDWLRTQGVFMSSLSVDPVVLYGDGIESEEEFEAAKSMFWGLPEVDRKLLFLRYFRGYTLAKCGELTGCGNKETVRKRVSQLTAKLRADTQQRIPAYHF